MADESTPTNPAAAQDERDERGQGQSRGGRPPGGRDFGGREGGGRDSGGFRIRLSDNEMQAARALQEAFGLRSTVAVLGFSLRTLAQQLEQGQLAELIAQQQAQGGGRPPAAREAARGGGERRRDRSSGEREEGRGGGRGVKVDPFARPSRPAAPPLEAEISADEQPAAESELADEAELAAEEPISAEAPPADAPAAPELEPEAAPQA
jgi:hypothetical protein